jgi:hypothetical protein
MKTDNELKSEGMEVLRSRLGLVESERFIALVVRDTFDYTLWRQERWADTTVEELAEQARQLRTKN